MLDLDTKRLCPRPGYMLEKVDNELLIYHPAEALVIYCNTTAAMVWQLLDGKRTAGQIATLVADAYADDRAAVERDVLGAISDLVERGAIEVAYTPAAATP